ncbi:MAG: ABC transporter ATP-binding protein [Lachnospirales bacterium]
MKMEVRDLCKCFSNKVVLDNLNFEFESGKCIAVLGRNGAGKTTLFRTILGIINHDYGEILIDGKPIDKDKIKIGYLPEERGLYLKRTVYEQMMYFGRLKGLSKEVCSQVIDLLLEKLEATEYKFKRLETLSKGNQQKIQLAISVIDNPDIIIFDEPFSGLDLVSAKILKDLIEDFASNGKLVIFSSHEITYLEGFCEYLAILHNNKIEITGSISEIKSNYSKNLIKVCFSNYNRAELAVYDAEVLSLCNNVDIDGNDVIFDLKDINYKNKLQKVLIDKSWYFNYFEVHTPTLEEIFIDKVG